MPKLFAFHERFKSIFLDSAQILPMSAHACSENNWEGCVKEKRLRFFGKMGVVVLLLRSLSPMKRPYTP